MKKEIEELKEVVMALHRSAGNLDEIICVLEDVEEGDEQYYKAYIKSQADYRKELREACFKDLDKKEDDIWNSICGEKES